MATLMTEAALVKVTLPRALRPAAKLRHALLNYTVSGCRFCSVWCGVGLLFRFIAVLCRWWFGAFLFCFFVAVVLSWRCLGGFLFCLSRLFCLGFVFFSSEKTHTENTTWLQKHRIRKIPGCWGRGILLSQQSFVPYPAASEKELCLKISEEINLLLAWAMETSQLSAVCSWNTLMKTLQNPSLAKPNKRNTNLYKFWECVDTTESQCTVKLTIDAQVRTLQCPRSRCLYQHRLG